jgi:preprotein translocase subunit YajC
MYSLFLADSTDNSWTMWIMVVAIIVIFAVFMFISSRKNKKRQQEAEDLINAVKPGNKVKTIGGVCGIVVEVDDEENTFVLETGSEASGKCYMKFDKQAIYQTDAVVEKADKKPAKEETAEVAETSQTEQEVKTEEQTEEQTKE